jgi:predicted ATPase/DNA-binding SARP family transcriptional activator
VTAGRWLHVRMQYDVLGALRVSRDGVDVTPRGPRPRDTLAVLLRRRGDTIPAEAILEHVWSGEADGLDVSAVHTVVSRLRAKLGKGSVETQEGGGYRLVTDGATIDEDVFTELMSDAARARERGDSPAATAALREALALWRSDTAYLDIADDLVVADRARLAEMRVDAHEQLTELLLESGPNEALALAQRLVADHPLRERPHQLLMLALYRAGRQADALTVYQDLRLRLRDELGIDPGPATTALQQQVLDHDPALDAARPPAGPAPTRARARVAVPLPALPLIGRDDELTAVLGSLEQGRRLLTLVGPGGVGKSRLLAEVGVRLADHAMAYVDLSGLGDADADELAEATARAVGLGVPGDRAVDDLVAGIGDSEVMLLLDEAEWALAATAALVQAVLHRCRGVRIVVTSRQALDVPGERRVVILPLDCPEVEADNDQVAASPAVRLLAERLLDHGGVLAKEDWQQLAVIARRVDGLPLALELVAAHATTHTVAELVALIDEPLALAAPEGGRADRHRSLRDTLLWSVDRLDTQHRTVLRRLGVFAGTFDIAAATAVVADPRLDTDQLVRDLAREALVQVERGTGALRVRLLRSVRDLALSELDGLALVEARRRHREWYAARWRGTMLHDDLVQVLRRDHDDYLAALRSGLQDGSSAVGDLTLTLTYLWIWTEALAPGLRWTERALQSGLMRPVDRARVQAQRAAMLMRTDARAASEALDEAIPVLLARGEANWLVSAYNVRAIECYDAGKLWSALAAAGDAVLWARRDALPRLPEALGLLAGVQAAFGEDEDPVATAEEAWALVRDTGSATDVVSVVGNIGVALTEAGAGERALELLTEAMDEVRRRWAGEPPLVMSLNAGWAALSAGQPDHALRLFRTLLAGRPDGEPDRWGVEAFAGAGCALVAVGSADGLRVLDGARELADRFGLVLTPWQVTRVEQARAQVLPDGDRASVDGRPPQPTSDLASELSALVRAAPTSGMDGTDGRP